MSLDLQSYIPNMAVWYPTIDYKFCNKCVKVLSQIYFRLGNLNLQQNISNFQSSRQNIVFQLLSYSDRVVLLISTFCGYSVIIDPVDNNFFTIKIIECCPIINYHYRQPLSMLCIVSHNSIFEHPQAIIQDPQLVLTV